MRLYMWGPQFSVENFAIFHESFCSIPWFSVGKSSEFCCSAWPCHSKTELTAVQI